MINGLILAVTAFIWTATVIDVLITDSNRVLRLPKAGWLFATLVMPLIGTIGWCLLGRPGHATTPPRPQAGRSWPSGPEDDPAWVIDTSPSRPTKAPNHNRR